MNLLDLKENREKIIEISKRYRAENIRIFGSVSRGEATDSSDIDFLVSFLPEASLLDQVGLIDALSKELQHDVDVVSDRALNRHLRQRILDEAQLL